MRRVSGALAAALVLSGLLALTGGCARHRDITGTWQLDRKRSSDTDPWRKIELKIERDGSTLTLHKRWAASRYSQERVLVFTTGGDTSAVELPAPKWPDTPHLGVWVKPGTVDKIVASWEKPGRSLRTVERYPLQTSQGEIALEVHKNYRVSEDGKTLTVTEERSTRPNGFTFVYVRK
ncbi:MAG TPA: hypothetical protein ENK07_02730 [Bacteroidetes bacterium]|nr:hypothetical protein [Bacteroidota bacterium]